MVMMKWVDIPQTGSGASLDMRSDKRDGADNYKVSALHWMSSERINNQMTTADWTGTHLSDCLSLSPFFPVSLYVFAFLPLFPTSIRFPSPSTALSMEKEAHARKKDQNKKTQNQQRRQKKQSRRHWGNQRSRYQADNDAGKKRHTRYWHRVLMDHIGHVIKYENNFRLKWGYIKRM